MGKYTVPANEPEATATALRLAGLDPAYLRRARTEIVDLTGDATPFVHDQISQLGQAWAITIDRIRWALPSSIPGYLDHYERTASILLAQTTGQLLRVEADAHVRDPDMRPLPPANIAEERLSKSGERFVGLPDEEPAISFLDALDRILSGGLGSPFNAKAVHGFYVLHTKLGSVVRPVWSITLRGIPPLEASVPRGVDSATIPMWQLNHARNVVDAVTGQVLYATSVPQPDGSLGR